MGDQNNQPTGSYQPTSGTTTGTTNDPVHSPRAQRLYPLPPDTTNAGRMQGMSGGNVSPSGVQHVNEVSRPAAPTQPAPDPQRKGKV